jgi:hypothetical protein
MKLEYSSQDDDTFFRGEHMAQTNAFSQLANEPQWLEQKLALELLRESPEYFGRVLAECRAARSAGHPEIATELLWFALSIARTIRQIDDPNTQH